MTQDPTIGRIMGSLHETTRNYCILSGGGNHNTNTCCIQSKFGEPYENSTELRKDPSLREAFGTVASWRRIDWYVVVVKKNAFLFDTFFMYSVYA